MKLAQILFFILAFTARMVQAEVVLKSIDDQDISFSSLKGKWVLINYWAGWCQSCLDEIPEFNHFYLHHKKENMALFAVNFDALPLLEQKSLIHKLHIAYPSLKTDPREALNLEDIKGVPATFVFNPEGKLVKILYGGQTAKSLEKAIS